MLALASPILGLIALLFVFCLVHCSWADAALCLVQLGFSLVGFNTEILLGQISLGCSVFGFVEMLMVMHQLKQLLRYTIGLVGQMLIRQLDKYYPCLGGQMVLLLTVGQILPGPDPLLGKYYRFQILLELGKYFWILLVGQILLNPSIDLVGQKPLNPSSWANG